MFLLQTLEVEIIDIFAHNKYNDYSLVYSINRILN